MHGERKMLFFNSKNTVFGSGFAHIAIFGKYYTTGPTSDLSVYLTPPSCSTGYKKSILAWSDTASTALKISQD